MAGNYLAGNRVNFQVPNFKDAVGVFSETGGLVGTRGGNIVKGGAAVIALRLISACYSTF